MTDDAEEKRRQHERALLHGGGGEPPPRQPNPGERLFQFELGQDVYRAELRDYHPHGVEGPLFENGQLLAASRFTVRELAIRWLEKKRAEILRSGGA